MVPDDDDVPPDSSQKGKAKRGFFGKLKDRAIGTKEERQAHKKERERVRTIRGGAVFSRLSNEYIFLLRSKERGCARGQRYSNCSGNDMRNSKHNNELSIIKDTQQALLTHVMGHLRETHMRTTHMADMDMEAVMEVVMEAATEAVTGMVIPAADPEVPPPCLS
jgi:hypothetical protein